MRSPGRHATAGPGLSSPVVSEQQAPHPRLAEQVRRHLESDWHGGRHRPTRQAFERLTGLLEAGDAGRLILDSGCGSGASTAWLAQRFPDHVVIGVDRSAARLEKTGGRRFPFRSRNCIWLRGELAAFWRLAHVAGWKLRRHYILYPNPWPKPRHLGRRWHAHPVFPTLLALGGEIEMRCNWEIYAREFEMAARIATAREVRHHRPDVSLAMSPFEAKYLASGHALWSVTIKAPGRRICLPDGQSAKKDC